MILETLVIRPNYVDLGRMYGIDETITRRGI